MLFWEATVSTNLGGETERGLDLSLGWGFSFLLERSSKRILMTTKLKKKKGAMKKNLKDLMYCQWGQALPFFERRVYNPKS